MGGVLPPDAGSLAKFVGLDGNHGSLPAVEASVDGENVTALYDSGSSSMELVLRPSDFLRVTGLASLDDAPLRVAGHSWGREVTTYISPCDSVIKIAGEEFHPKLVWSSQFMDDIHRAMGCDVIIGNELFMGRTLYLDFDHKRLAISGVE